MDANTITCSPGPCIDGVPPNHEVTFNLSLHAPMIPQAGPYDYQWAIRQESGSINRFPIRQLTV